MDRDPQPVTGSQSTSEEQPSATRRGFLGFLTVVLSAVPLVGGLLLTGLSGLSPTKDNRPKRIRLCKKSELPAEGSKDIVEFVVSYECRQGPRVESVVKVVFVTRDPANNEVIAMDGECTHVGCPVQRREVTVQADDAAPLQCQCHGGKFSQVGDVLAGPPKVPLRRLRIEEVPDDPEIVYVARF